jgi:hypothetical protein
VLLLLSRDISWCYSNLEEKELDIMEKEFFVVTRKRKFILHFNLRMHKNVFRLPPLMKRYEK